jgi:hypothetical protein
MTTGAKLKQGWMAIVGRFGHIQTMVMLVFFYVLLVGPAASISRIGRRDYLEKRQLEPARSAWHDADSASPDLDRAKLQT